MDRPNRRYKRTGRIANLTRLSLWDAPVSDIRVLAELTNLIFLRLGGDSISDIRPLANLTNLTELLLMGSQINDINTLAELTNLEILFLESTQVSDIGALAGLASLRVLDLRNSPIRNINALAGLTNLERLNLHNSQVSDVSVLAGLNNLTQGIWLIGNPISAEQIAELREALPDAYIMADETIQAPQPVPSPVAIEEPTVPPSPTMWWPNIEPQDVSKLYSPNGKYFIEGIDVFWFQWAPGSVPEEQKIRIVEVDSGLIVWEWDWPGTMHQEPQYLWSPDDRYVSVTYGGHVSTEAIVVDTADMTQRRLPHFDELIPLLPDYAPDFSRWGRHYFIPQKWADETTIAVQFYWTFYIGDVDEMGDAAFMGNVPRIYLYNIQTGELTVES